MTRMPEICRVPGERGAVTKTRFRQQPFLTFHGCPSPASCQSKEGPASRRGQPAQASSLPHCQETEEVWDTTSPGLAAMPARLVQCCVQRRQEVSPLLFLGMGSRALYSQSCEGLPRSRAWVLPPGLRVRNAASAIGLPPAACAARLPGFKFWPFACELGGQGQVVQVPCAS